MATKQWVRDKIFITCKVIIQRQLFSDKICLPKEKRKLSFRKLFPGCKIEVPDDDEDWESSAFRRLLVQGILHKILELMRNPIFFPIGEEAIYFESEKEACEMAKMHFPGDDICTMILR